MGHVFSDLEGLRIAVEMEKRGEAFYRRAAKISHSPQTVSLLNALADEECLHGQEFQALYDRECAQRERAGDEPCPCEEAYDSEVSAYLSAIAADIIFPGGLMALRQSGFDNPEAVFRAAIASEKDSILFYEELARCARDAHAQSVFMEIARQERSHMLRLQRQKDMLAGEN